MAVKAICFSVKHWMIILDKILCQKEKSIPVEEFYLYCQENVEQNNRQFLFVIAPNKNSLYPEYMPKRYIKTSEQNNYSLLQAEMKKENINTVDLKKMFIDSGKEVYHKLDSHWNNQGAAMGCNAILNYLGKDHYDYTNERHTIKKNFSGDLYGMVISKRKTKKIQM